MHRARWMARAIYSLKIYLFRKQFNLTKFELKALTRINKFILTVYLEAWFTAPDAISAPRHDLTLLKRLKSYEDSEIKQVTVDKFLRHQDYLEEENICLALFDKNVHNPMKLKMAERILNHMDGKEYQNKRSVHELQDCVSPRSINFFSILGINPDFLRDEKVDRWSEYESFKEAEEICATLNVVNDSAERAIALGQKFNSFATEKEDQKQAILTNVFRNRKNLKVLTKTEIIKNIQ